MQMSILLKGILVVITGLALTTVLSALPGDAYADAPFGTQQIISTDVEGASTVYSVDLDGDGDMDVLSGSKSNTNPDKLVWYQNTDGAGTFGAEQIISTAVDWVQSVYATDLDGDGDLDVLSASYNDDKIAWYPNSGAGTFGSQQVISSNANGAYSVYAADLDRDGDLDVLSASFFDHNIAWYKNTDGSGTFGMEQVISTAMSGTTDVHAEDIDGDGDLDVVSASYWDGKVAWYENTDGAGTFGAQQEIISITEGKTTSVYAADMDNDGDVDVLSTSETNNKIAWYENLLTP